MDGSGALIQDMIRFSALGYQRGLIVGTGGNVSCRCPEGVCITASGTCLGDMDAEDILLVNLSGCVMQGAAGKRPSIETPFHIADTLTEYPGIKAFLLAGHGAVALGSSPEDAFYTAELLEQTAKLAYMLEQ